MRVKNSEKSKKNTRVKRGLDIFPNLCYSVFVGIFIQKLTEEKKQCGLILKIAPSGRSSIAVKKTTIAPFIFTAILRSFT